MTFRKPACLAKGREVRDYLSTCGGGYPLFGMGVRSTLTTIATSVQ